MPMREELNSSRPIARHLDAVLLILGMMLLTGVVVASYFAAADVGDALTRNTIRLSLAWYFISLLLMIAMQPGDWAAATLRGRLARWCWTWGVVAFLVHLGMAFHYFHDWSHAHAFEHTRQESGWGEGLYVSYAFTLLWIADAAWWWVSPARYARRSAFWHAVLHAFLLFIAFNAAVVFETGLIRWAGILAIIVIMFTWYACYRGKSLARAS
jgi:hypothetical protein